MKQHTKIVADRWSATVLTGADIDGWRQVYCTTVGDTQGHALEAAEYVLNTLAAGRAAYIRVAPESASDLDFDSKITRHTGITRFHYRLDAGEWKDADPVMTIPLGAVAK